VQKKTLEVYDARKRPTKGFTGRVHTLEKVLLRGLGHSSKNCVSSSDFLLRNVKPLFGSSHQDKKEATWFLCPQFSIPVCPFFSQVKLKMKIAFSKSVIV